MRFLVDILRPAHVHFFHPFIEECERAGIRVLITVRRAGLAAALLEAYGHPYRILEPRRERSIDLVWDLLLGNRALEASVLEFGPDALLGVGGISIAAVGSRLDIPAHVFCDTESAMVSNWLTFPRATEVITPRSFLRKVRGRHVTYAGYQALAYLHPARFAPDPGIRAALGAGEGEVLSLVRFSSSRGSQDFFRRGFGPEGKCRLVESLLARGRVFISSEDGLPPDLERLRFPLPPLRFHDAIAAADLVVGESAVVASEAAVLGTPAVFCSPAGRGYLLDEERRSGLVRNTAREADAIAAAAAILDLADKPSVRTFRQEARKVLLAGAVDLTAWMLDRLGARAGARRPSPALEPEPVPA